MSAKAPVSIDEAKFTQHTPTSFPVHGLWCGPGWTGGKRVNAGEFEKSGGDWNTVAVDALDAACRDHDKACSDGGCTPEDDFALAAAAANASLSSSDLRETASAAALATVMAAKGTIDKTSEQLDTEKLFGKDTTDPGTLFPTIDKFLFYTRPTPSKGLNMALSDVEGEGNPGLYESSWMLGKQLGATISKEEVTDLLEYEGEGYTVDIGMDYAFKNQEKYRDERRETGVIRGPITIVKDAVQDRRDQAARTVNARTDELLASDFPVNESGARALAALYTAGEEVILSPFTILPDVAVGTSDALMGWLFD